jgi:diguanylate cyclase (GGDEF)-like protein
MINRRPVGGPDVPSLPRLADRTRLRADRSRQRRPEPSNIGCRRRRPALRRAACGVLPVAVLLEPSRNPAAASIIHGGPRRRFTIDDNGFRQALAEACRLAAEPRAETTEPVAAIDAVLDRLEAAGAGVCWSVFLFDHGRLWTIAQRGYAMLPDGLPPDRGIMARALREQRLQYVPDIAADPDYVAGFGGMTSEIAMPLRAHGSVIGVLTVEAPFRLPEAAAEELEGVAEHLAGLLALIRDSPALDLSSLARLFVHMSSLRDARAIADLAARSIAHVLGLDAAHVLIPEEEGSTFVASWSAGTGEPPSAELVERLRAAVDESSVFDLVDTDVAGLTELAGGALTLVWLPLRVNAIEVGVLVGEASGALVFPRRQAEAAALLAAQAAGSIDAALALVRERRTASTDALTGLLNRRGFGDRLEHELERAAAGRSPLSLLVLDCDDFKTVNDRGGHERGDRVLAEVGSLILARLAPDAAAGRLGGDEFAVMLPDTDAGPAHVHADELRVALSRGLAAAGTSLHLSVGVATYPFDGPGATQLLRAADQALYVAKSSGKDLVVAFRDLAEWLRRGDAGRAKERRARQRIGAAETASVADALAAESELQAVLVVLCRALTSMLSATAAQVSRLDGQLLFDVASYALRDVDLGGSAAYLVSDFPLTQDVLERREPRAMSFVDDRIDRAEAFVLRELNMNSLLMLPFLVEDRVWGLVEVYDVRLRRFDDDDVAIAAQLAALAARRLAQLAGEGRLPELRADGMPVQRPMRSGPPGDRQLRAGA